MSNFVADAAAEHLSVFAALVCAPLCDSVSVCVFAFTCRCRCRRRCLFACVSVSVRVCVCVRSSFALSLAALDA